MRKAVIIVLALAGLAVVAGLVWQKNHSAEVDGQIVLYGNVDLRQVLLAFNNNERIAEVLVQEGDRLKKGQLVARLDTSRLEPQSAQARAQVAAQQQVVDRLHAGSRPEEIAEARANVAAQQQVVDRLHTGSRPEEIAQARANVAAAQADVVNQRAQYRRAEPLVPQGTVTEEEFDNIRAALADAEGRLDYAQQALDLAIEGPRKEDIAEAEARLASLQQVLDLAIAGPRKEDIAQAEAQLRATQAEAQLIEQQLTDANLYAPTDSVVRSRIMEPGEMASPQKPVFSLAIIDPKWVRAYVSEPQLGYAQPGMKATVAVDSFPDRQFSGWVGFVSPVAEFTPKTVQTEELRTSLVYEVRVFVDDPQDVLRLGMPATVYLELETTPHGAEQSEAAAPDSNPPSPQPSPARLSSPKSGGRGSESATSEAAP
jgi:HlyD family secretion protein